jgi:hypothetical protein
MPSHPPTDFDVHGAVAIRLVDAEPRDARVVERQLGPSTTPLDRDPDVVIRFVDRMPPDGRLRFLGKNEAAFTDARYLVLQGRHKSPVKVSIPFDQLAGDSACEIVVERGLMAIPLLVAIVNLTAFGNGSIPLHAVAFVHEGRGVLTLGWAKGGKSETLLAFTAQGADFVGDEWIHLDPASGRLHALSEPMRVWDWQIRSLPGLADRIPGGDRRRLMATRALSASLEAVGAMPLVGRSRIGRLAARVREPVERQLSVQVPPGRLLGRAPLPDGAQLDRVVLVMSHATSDLTVEQIDAADVAARATQSFLFELADLFAHYRRFRFAFPDRRNVLIDQLETRYEAAVSAALAGVPAIAVSHPYPLQIARLYDVIAPALA